MNQTVVDDPLELISALADGELQGEELARALTLLAHDEQARAYWHACHVTGDVLRSRELAHDAAGDAAFMARLAPRLRGTTPKPAPRPAMAWVGRLAANDAWGWPRVAGLAALALGVAVAWHVGGGDVGAPAQLAQIAPASQPAEESTVQTMIRDPRLDQLLAAHRELGGVSALQKPSGFLRNATFERSKP